MIKVWVLVIAMYHGGMVTIPGYFSQQQCVEAAKSVVDHSTAGVDSAYNISAWCVPVGGE